MAKSKCPDCGKSIRLDENNMFIVHEITIRISKKSNRVTTCMGSGKKA